MTPWSRTAHIRIFWGFLIGIIGFCDFCSARLLPRAHESPKELMASCFYQDDSGFMWIGSETGLFRFDGSHWVSFPRPGMILDTVTAINEGPDGRLWVGFQDGGICWVGRENLIPFTPEEGLPKAPVSGIVFDQQDRLWFSTYGEGLYYQDGNRLYNIDTDEGLPSKEIYEIAVDILGRIWAATDHGLGICSVIGGKKQVRIIDHKTGLPDSFVQSVATSDGLTIWIGSYGAGLTGFDVVSEELIFCPGWQGGPVSQLIPIQQEVWFIDEKSGLWRWDGQAYQQESEQEFLSLYADKAANLWWMSPGNGLFSAPLYIRHYGAETGEVKALAIHPNGGVDFVNGKTLFHHNRGLTQASKDLPDQVFPSALYTDIQGRLWMGTRQQGIWRYDEQDQQWLDMTPTEKRNCPPILSITGDETHLWMATFGGVFRCKFEHNSLSSYFKQRDQADGLGINYIYDVMKDESGRIWLATDGHGVGVWGSNLHLIPELQQHTIYSIVQDELGKIWMGSENGKLFCSDQGAIQSFDIPEIEGSDILAIGPYSPQGLVLIHTTGVILWSYQTGSTFALSALPGFPETGRSLNTLIQDLNAHIWLGTREGIIQFLPEYLPPEFQPVPRLVSVQVNLEDIFPDIQHIYAHDQNQWLFEYAGLWYQQPEAVRYEHRLMGLSDQWESSKDQRASYPHLPPGDYQFQLKAAVGNSFAETKILRYDFHISKPYWQTIWFWGLVLLTSGGMGWGIVRYRENIARKMAEYHRRQIEHQFNTLKSQINPHFLFNSFNTLLGVIEEDPEAAIPYVERLSDFFRNILAYRNNFVITLKEEVELLENYIALQQVRYGTAFRVDIFVPESFRVCLIPPLTLQLCLENALKHNIVSEKKPLHVRISIEDTGCLVVRNNLQLRTDTSSSTHFGLENIKENYRHLTKLPVGINRSADWFEVCLPLPNVILS